MKNLLIAFGISLILISCSEQKEIDQPDMTPQTSAVTYEIFVQSFADSNGDGIGDFNGMTSKLDYLEDLGIDAVWLMPIMPSPTYHKYDVIDYKAVHPDYGTMDEFKEFVQKAHDRNIKVIIDLIINHTSNNHPWFVASSSSPNSEYREYYVWANKDSIADQLAKKETSFDSDNITQWHAVNGDTTKEHYYGFFWGGMPDLNFDSRKVRQEIYDIGKFWLEEVGVDGFRLDAAKHIYPDDRAEDNHAFWREFKNEMENIKPDVYLVGEVWSDATTAAPFAQGLTALFNFDLAFSILESVKKGKNAAATISGHGWEVIDGKSVMDAMIENRKVFKQMNPKFIDAPFLSNHDQNRVMSVLGNDQNKAKVAASILFTLPGTPYIYYGEEIGMLGMKPDEHIREPFLWDAEASDGIRATWLKPKFTKDSTVAHLASQMSDPNSLYNHYKDWINLRKATSALTSGDIVNKSMTDERLISFTRSTGDEELWFYIIYLKSISAFLFKTIVKKPFILLQMTIQQ